MEKTERARTTDNDAAPSDLRRKGYGRESKHFMLLYDSATSEMCCNDGEGASGMTLRLLGIHV